MNFYQRFEKEERTIFWICTSVCILCLLLLTPVSDEFLFSKNANATGTLIGKITYHGNDTRLRQRDEMVWRPTKSDQSINVGDSIFAGAKSSAEVELTNKNQISVGENSLVVFKLADKTKIADLQSGNFRFKVNGNIKIAIRGEITEVTGKNSEIQFYMDKNQKPQARLIKGKASVKKKNQKPIILTENKFVQLPKVPTNRKIAHQEPLPITTENTLPEPEPPVVLPVPKIQNAASPIAYKWKLYDLYDRRDLILFEKTAPSTQVAVDQKLSWADEGRDSFVEFSKTIDFINSEKFSPLTSSLELKKVHTGENFWRVSYDKKIWSDVGTFTVTPVFLEANEMFIPNPKGPIPLVTEATSLQIQLKNSMQNPLGFIVQASQKGDFPLSESKLFWSAAKQININFFKTGNYYYRFRAVSKNQELTDWSPATKFTVFTPLPPAPPALARLNKHNLVVGEELEAAWTSKGIATRIEVIDQNGNFIKDSDNTRLRWIPEKEGEYQVHAWTMNQYGQQSSTSEKLVLKVVPKPVAPPALLLAKQESERKPTSTDSTNTLKIDGAPLATINDKYKSSKLAANSFIWTQFSSVQFYNSEASPIVSGLALHGLYWKDAHGFEGLLKSGVVGMNSIGSSQKSLRSWEGRYHYRFFTKMPWTAARQLQISTFLGFEMYRNSGGSYTSSYDLLKFGTSLEFPWASRWTGGGEFVFGLGQDKTQKKEVSGHVGYFLSPDWSLGVGYRIHLLDAGSPKSTPQNSLPYREGYTEGFSVLNYHF